MKSRPASRPKSASSRRSAPRSAKSSRSAAFRFPTKFFSIAQKSRLTSFVQFIHGCATRIQKVYRGMLCRREYAKMVAKTKKGGKKGKKGKK